MGEVRCLGPPQPQLIRTRLVPRSEAMPSRHWRSYPQYFVGTRAEPFSSDNLALKRPDDVGMKQGSHPHTHLRLERSPTTVQWSM